MELHIEVSSKWQAAMLYHHRSHTRTLFASQIVCFYGESSNTCHLRWCFHNNNNAKYWQINYKFCEKYAHDNDNHNANNNYIKFIFWIWTKYTFIRLETARVFNVNKFLLQCQTWWDWMEISKWLPLSCPLCLLLTLSFILPCLRVCVWYCLSDAICLKWTSTAYNTLHLFCSSNLFIHSLCLPRLSVQIRTICLHIFRQND